MERKMKKWKIRLINFIGTFFIWGAVFYANDQGLKGNDIGLNQFLICLVLLSIGAVLADINSLFNKE